MQSWNRKNNNSKKRKQKVSVHQNFRHHCDFMIYCCKDDTHFVCACACVRACVRACVCARARACVCVLRCGFLTGLVLRWRSNALFQMYQCLRLLPVREKHKAVFNVFHFVFCQTFDVIYDAWVCVLCVCVCAVCVSVCLREFLSESVCTHLHIFWKYTPEQKQLHNIIHQQRFLDVSGDCHL